MCRFLRSLHALKLHIIERNLYGVDIDEFAVNIAMLRLWLSLAIDFDGDTPPALPNLDFKIVRGDSLLGPDPSPDNYPDLFRYQAVQAAERIATLKAEFMKRTANTKTQVKEEVEQEEDALRDALIDTAAPDGAVDWRVQFAEVFALRGGFDVAIANPPYLFGEAMPSRAGLHQYVLARGQYDAYWLFHERSLNSLLSPNGVHCFINSDALLARDESRIVRDFLLASLKSLVLSHVGMVFQRAGVSAVDNLWGRVTPDGEAPWSILFDVERSVMAKVVEIGTPLSEWGVRINYGIKTGYNPAFIIDTQTRDSLIEQDPKSVEIIKPILRGRDIRRWRAHWANQWLIYAHSGIDIEAYPAIYAHLSPHRAKLQERRGGGRRDSNE